MFPDTFYKTSIFFDLATTFFLMNSEGKLKILVAQPMNRQAKSKFGCQLEEFISTVDFSGFEKFATLGHNKIFARNIRGHVIAFSEAQRPVQDRGHDY